MATFVSLAVSLVLSGAESAVNDDRFKTVPSKSAATVLTVGKSLVVWLNANHEDADVLCSPLVSAIHGCIPSKLTSVQSRECLWKQYHQLRCSEMYFVLWQKLFQKIGIDDSPLLLAQYIGDHILNNLIKRSSPIEENSTGNDQEKAINEVELKALRYVAGYIPRSLKKKLKKSAHPLRRQLQICLWDLLDDEDEGGTADDWLKTIDRGGLMRVNEMTFQVFVAVERKVRKYLKVDSHHLDLGTICGDVLGDEDVLFYWSIVSSDWAKEEAEQLLKMVVDLYVTIRGFAFASAWVEEYKACTKTNLQKSKGLRKKINTD